MITRGNVKDVAVGEGPPLPASTRSEPFRFGADPGIGEMAKLFCSMVVHAIDGMVFFAFSPEIARLAMFRAAFSRNNTQLELQHRNFGCCDREWKRWVV